MSRLFLILLCLIAFQPSLAQQSEVLVLRMSASKSDAALSRVQQDHDVRVEPMRGGWETWHADGGFEALLRDAHAIPDVLAVPNVRLQFLLDDPGYSLDTRRTRTEYGRQDQLERYAEVPREMRTSANQ